MHGSGHITAVMERKCKSFTEISQGRFQSFGQVGAKTSVVCKALGVPRTPLENAPEISYQLAGNLSFFKSMI